MNFRQFDRFLRTQLWIGIPTHLNWALVIPVVHDLQGEIWTSSTIAVYFVAMNVATLLVKLFEGLSLSTTYLVNNLLSLMMAVAMVVCLYGYTEEFLIMDAILGVGFATMGAVHTVNFRDWMVGEYSREILKEYTIYKTMRKSVGSIAGFAIVALLYQGMSPETSMKWCLGATLCILVLKQYNWWTFFRHMK